MVGAVTVAYTQMNPESAPARFGFIVAKNVGNAVTRNRVRRRLKAASFAYLDRFPAGTEVVFRAFPSAATSSYAEITADLARVAGRLES